MKSGIYNGAFNVLGMTSVGQEVGKVGHLNTTCFWDSFEGNWLLCAILLIAMRCHGMPDILCSSRGCDGGILETCWTLNLRLVLRLPSFWAELHISTHSPSFSTWAEDIRLAGIFNTWWCFQVRQYKCQENGCYEADSIKVLTRFIKR